MTHSDDSKCSLFEDLLENFFDEYSSVYGAMSDTEIVDDVSCMEYKNDASVEVTFTNDVEISDEMLGHLREYFKKNLSKTHYVKIERPSEHKVLISLKRKG